MKVSGMKKLAVILAGNAMYAFAIVYFILPVGLITGGTTGIALTVRHYTGMEISSFVSVFNVVMFLLGAWILGKTFAMTTIVSTLVYPILLKFAQWTFEKTGVLTQDFLLCTVFAGVMIGAGIGIIIAEGASTGGMDIPPLIINKKKGISVAAMLNFFDICILLMQIVFSNKEQVLYGIILVCIYTYTLDKVLMMGKSKVQIKIISEKYEEINRKILEVVDRGTTLLKAEGGFTRMETCAILTVVSKRELFHVNELVHTIDQDAFLVIDEVKEVKGKGFTKGKVYRDQE